MCLAVPGQIIELEGEGLSRTGRVNFSGVVKQVSLAYTPEAALNDYVLVHVGFALQVVDEAEAQQVFAYLQELGELDEIRGDTTDALR